MSIAPFDAFFEAVNNGQRPLPWQRRLAARVVERGWPAAIGVPTGLGKTACLDIAVWAMAAEADRPPSARRLPTRIWYVVNRRLLVDEAGLRARRLADILAEDSDGPVGTVAAALRARQHHNPDSDALPGSRPLHAPRLRGGLDDVELPGSPAQPAIICATVPMFGSRLLFRGYGGGRYTRSIETALAAVDTLVLLDEAHLSQSLARLVAQLGETDNATSSVLPPPRSHPILVSLTATGDQRQDRFDLDLADLADPIVAERLDAAKPTALVGTDGKSLSAVLAAEVVARLALASCPLGAVIFTNTARRALDVYKLLPKALRSAGVDAERTLLTGRLRPVDADAVRAALLDGPSGLRAGRDRSVLRNHHIAIATQTLEVGADLDFDVLVTQTADLRAIVQRFGRLNRRGLANELASAAIVHAGDQADDPVYGSAPAALWERLREQLQPIDLRPALINDVLGEPSEQELRAPELLPNHLDELAKTTSPARDEAPVHLFFEGIEDQQLARVQVIWRSYLPPQRSASASHHTGPRSRTDLVPRLSEAETVELPLYEVRDFLEARDPDGTLAWRLGDDRLSLEPVSATGLRPGDRVVLPSKLGGYAEPGGWDPDEAAAVIDRSAAGGQLLFEQATILQALSDGAVDEGHRTVLAAAAAAFGRPTDGTLRALDDALADSSQADVAARATALSALLRETIDEAADGQSSPVASEAAAAVLAGWLRSTGALAADATELSSPDGCVWVAGRRSRRRIGWTMPEADELDELSATDAGTKLGPHLRGVGATAERIAAGIGLSAELQMAVGNAGRLHDLGKAEPRFQRWLGAGNILAAKSSGYPRQWRAQRLAAGWPSGGRHEALSVRVAEAAMEELTGAGFLAPDADLVLHLVASHHGRGRPGLLGVEDGIGATFAVPLDELLETGALPAEVKVEGTLAVHDWDQPRRFREVNQRYGRRGVALLEAVMRQADWIVSAIGEGDRSA